MFEFIHRRQSMMQRLSAFASARIRSFAVNEVSRILGPWIFDEGFSNIAIGFALGSIRTKSRWMAKNSEYYFRFIQLFVANVVGPEGFRLKSLAEKPEGEGFEIDEDAEEFVEEHFWRWCRRPDFCDLTGRKSFASICRLCADNWARDGEYVVYLDTAAQNPYGISLRVIRPDALDESMNSTGDRLIRNGVEVDPFTLRPVAYYIVSGREDTGAFLTARGYRVRVPASQIVHGFLQHDETQTRGIPPGHAALRKLKMLDEYNVSELVAARDEANTLGVFTAPSGRESEILDLNDTSNADANAARAELESNSEPGARVCLPQGWTYDNKTPQHPNREVTAFKNTMLRDVASGLGVEYACFANDWAGVTYSSVRAGTLAERDQWMIYQAMMIEQLVVPVFRAWLRSFLSLAISGKYMPADFDRLSVCEFRGRRWSWVDPLKDVNAAVIAVQHGWKTDTQVASDYGQDFEDNLEEIKRLKEKKSEAGVGDSPVAKPASDNPSSEDQNGDGNKPDKSKEPENEEA